MPLSVVLLTAAISALGAWARTVFCTAGGSSLNFVEAFSMLWLHPTSKPAAANIVITYFFISVLSCVKPTAQSPCLKWVYPLATSLGYSPGPFILNQCHIFEGKYGATKVETKTSGQIGSSVPLGDSVFHRHAARPLGLAGDVQSVRGAHNSIQRVQNASSTA